MECLIKAKKAHNKTTTLVNYKNFITDNKNQS